MYSTQNSPLSCPWDLFAHEADTTSPHEELIRFNLRVQEEGHLTNLNESFLEQKLDELQSLPPSRPELYWLTFARLAELTLYCAGNYADSGYFLGVGDLLFNPRLIKVYIKGRAAPVVKKRHGALTEQFRHFANSETTVVPWMIQNTLLETAKEPLLAEMCQAIESSGFFAQWYLDSIKNRMIQVADTSSSLAVRSLWHETGSEEYLGIMSDPEQEMVLERRCRFEKTLFEDLGKEILRLIADPSCETKYLTMPNWRSLQSLEEIETNFAVLKRPHPAVPAQGVLRLPARHRQGV
jgi:hypothetical protein